MLNEIRVDRKTKLYAKPLPQKSLCHFSFKCKSRADIVFSSKENGRQPNDLGLCEKHALEMLEALQIMYGRNVGATEQIIIEASKSLALAEQTLDRYKRLVDAVFYSKDRKLAFSVVENLLKEENLKWDGVPNIMKAIDMYITYQKPIKEITMPTINEVMEKETQHVSEEQEEVEEDIEEEVEEESDLDKLLRQAAEAEGLNKESEEADVE